jgi:hypothetical protein
LIGASHAERAVGQSFQPRFASRSSAASQLQRRPRRDAAAAVRSSSNAFPAGIFTLPADDLALP